MVGYDEDNSALTLGDDDVLKVGDYELQYNSTSGDWEATYTPTGDVANVPTSQSGSLFPTDVADALAGQALADDGNLYSSVQNAVNNATSYVLVGPGKFDENVSIGSSMMLVGSGYDTHIDGGNSGKAIDVTATDVTVKNLSIETTGGGTGDYSALKSNSGSCTFENITVRDADRFALWCNSNDIVRNCTVENCDHNAILTATPMIVSGCHIENAMRGVVVNSQSEVVVANNTVRNTGDDGINLASSGDIGNNVVIGNRVMNAGDYGIIVTSDNNIIANNRASGSSNSDIGDGGTGNVTDDNLTGASN